MGYTQLTLCRMNIVQFQNHIFSSLFTCVHCHVIRWAQENCSDIFGSWSKLTQQWYSKLTIEAQKSFSKLFNDVILPKIQYQVEIYKHILIEFYLKQFIMKLQKPVIFSTALNKWNTRRLKLRTHCPIDQITTRT